jgi:orotidine-5'-phosphate decarboxylase
MKFKKKLLHISDKNESILCIGLDIDKAQMPLFLFETSGHPFWSFNKSIIDQTKDLVCAYKLNMAFYEVLGSKGIELLEKTMRYISQDIVVILDGKRNDIGNSARKYAQSLFQTYSADAVTVNPYIGIDSILPFLEYKDKCTFILCRTSNPSASDFQDIEFNNSFLYQFVAQKIKEWNIYDTCGAVAGATYPQQLKTIRTILGEDIPLLIPGVGKQGGEVKKTVKYGGNTRGEMAIINSSRGIIYAGRDEHFAEAARDRAYSLKQEINKYR